VKSTTVSDSPLFQTRIQRATNQQHNLIPSKYLGMGKVNDLNLFISIRDNERILFQKSLNKLHGMDDETFTKFLEQVFVWLSTQEEYNKVNVPQLIITLYQIRENPKQFEQYLVYDNNYLPVNPVNTINRWYPGCLIFNIMKVFFLISVLFVVVLFSSQINTCSAINTCQWECGPNKK